MIEKVLIVSADGHVGPSVSHDLRPYCPRANIDELDRFVLAMNEHGYTSSMRIDLPRDHVARVQAAGRIPGVRDAAARLRDLDEEGIACEVLFHGAANGESIPFTTFGIGAWGSEQFRDLEPLGVQLYNRWLSDFVATDPARLYGVAHFSPWRVEDAVAEVRRAHADGLRAVNLPAPRRDLIPYNDRQWDPFWAVCQELGMPLMTHAGAGDFPAYTGIESAALWMTETAWYGRRGLWFLIFGGVFHRFPALKLVLTEQFGDWVPETMRDLESVYLATQQEGLRKVLPNPPSYYWEHNVYVGASFPANFEIRLSVAEDFTNKLMWGADYPHVEGTWPASRAAICTAFEGVDLKTAKDILSANAIRALELNATKLESVAARIGPTAADLFGTKPELPEYRGLAFRTIGKFA